MLLASNHALLELIRTLPASRVRWCCQLVGFREIRRSWCRLAGLLALFICHPWRPPVSLELLISSCPFSLFERRFYIYFFLSRSAMTVCRLRHVVFSSDRYNAYICFPFILSLSAFLMKKQKLNLTKLIGLVGHHQFYINWSSAPYPSYIQTFKRIR